MLKYYLLTAWRHLARQKLFAAINIVGLAIGLTVFILIFLYVKKEVSWDRHWDNADRLAWLTYEFTVNADNAIKNTFVPMPAMTMVRDNFPEVVEDSAMLIQQGPRIVVGENSFNGSVQFADASVLDMLDLEVVSGSLDKVFAVPGQVALREDFKENTFGDADALGQTITLQIPAQGFDQSEPAREVDLQVGAVYRKPEETSLFLSNLSLLDVSTVPSLNDEVTMWQAAPRGMALLLLRDGVDVSALNARLPGLVDTLAPKEPWRVLQPGQRMSDFHHIVIQPLVAAHFDDTLPLDSGGDRTKVTVFALIGLVVLAMGSINTVILATARADDRKKEVGVRKVLGAKRPQLVRQFLGESVAYALVSLLLALGLAAAVLPVFSNLIDLELGLDTVTVGTVGQLVLITLGVGVLAGLYPALVMSGYSPVSVFRAVRISLATRVFNLRSVLACLQFAVTIALVVATAVLYLQLNHVRTLDPGFRTENLFTLMVNPQDRDLIVPLVNEVSSLPGVEKVALSSRRPGVNGAMLTSFGKYANDRANAEADFTGVFVDEGFFDVYELPLIAGRTFDVALDIPIDDIPPTDDGSPPPLRVVINNTMALSLGFATPEAATGEVVSQSSTNRDGKSGKRPIDILGVVEDTRFDSLNAVPENRVYLFRRDVAPVLTMAFSGAYRDNIQGEVESIWKELSDNGFSRGAFVEDALLEEFAQEENDGRLLMAFSGLAIFIASLGLYGIATYAVKKGIKEIGIRKVLGAGTRQVLLLFLWRFSLPVLVANLLAWPVAVVVMLRWLQRFNEQIGYGLLVPICLLATGLALSIAWLTVIATTARAARTDPVKSLRYE